MEAEKFSKVKRENQEAFVHITTYMEYHGDLVRHSLLKYWYEVGTKIDDCGTRFDEHGTKYNPEVVKYNSLCTNTPPGGAKRGRGV